jgi:hypothetical protein
MCMCLLICIYVCMYVCMYVCSECKHTDTYIHTYIHIHAYTQGTQVGDPLDLKLLHASGWILKLVPNSHALVLPPQDTDVAVDINNRSMDEDMHHVQSDHPGHVHTQDDDVSRNGQKSQSGQKSPGGQKSQNGQKTKNGQKMHARSKDTHVGDPDGQSCRLVGNNDDDDDDDVHDDDDDNNNNNNNNEINNNDDSNNNDLNNVNNSHSNSTSKNTDDDKNQGVSIVRRFEFNAELQRMSVVVRGAHGRVRTYVKGSPEAIMSLCDKRTVPQSFAQVCVCVCVCVWAYVCTMYVCIKGLCLTGVYVCAYIYIYTYICLYVCMCVYIYIHGASWCAWTRTRVCEGLS